MYRLDSSYGILLYLYIFDWMHWLKIARRQVLWNIVWSMLLYISNVLKTDPVYFTLMKKNISYLVTFVCIPEPCNVYGQSNIPHYEPSSLRRNIAFWYIILPECTAVIESKPESYLIREGRNLCLQFYHLFLWRTQEAAILSWDCCHNSQVPHLFPQGKFLLL